jgi:2-polyprenyl-6-methoxyphenol hydroxylase-like FAD-dependent oxidoreductase
MERKLMKIGVIGAGISGLTFATAIRRFAPRTQVELYERDLSPTSRSQGYSLGLKGDGAIPVLKAIGLYDQIALQVVTIQNFVFCDQRGQVLLELSATTDETRLTQRVKRSVLKTILLEGIGETPIYSNMLATGFRQNDRGVEVNFENGQTAQVDYLVACDGVVSAIRQQMIGDQKRYLGLTTILLDSPHLLKHPLLEGGYFLTLGDNGASLFCYRQPDGIHLSYTVHAESESDITSQAADSLLNRVQEETKAWHSPIPEITALVDPASLVVRGYYDKEPLQHVRQGRVWLVGDAAHPMSPFQGQGANMAMVDALRLAQFFGELEANPQSAEMKAQTLEKDIVTRGRKAVLESRNAAKQFHSTSHMQQMFRNFGFRMGNVFIRMATKK